MSDLKFTNENWHIANGTQVRSSKHQIARVNMFGKGEGKANAHLIASAPDLYEALRCFATGEGLPPGQTIEDILAKARGETPQVIVNWWDAASMTNRIPCWVTIRGRLCIDLIYERDGLQFVGNYYRYDEATPIKPSDLAEYES